MGEGTYSSNRLAGCSVEVKPQAKSPYDCPRGYGEHRGDSGFRHLKLPPRAPVFSVSWLGKNCASEEKHGKHQMESLHGTTSFASRLAIFWSLSRLKRFAPFQEERSTSRPPAIPGGNRQDHQAIMLQKIA
jgi:hypothetical protein